MRLEKRNKVQTKRRVAPCHARTPSPLSSPQPRDLDNNLDRSFLHISSRERDFDCGAPSVLA